MHHVLLIHQNLAGRFRHVARHLAARPDVERVCLGSAKAPGLDAIAPTLWQKSRHQAAYADKIRVAHEGVDTETFRPDPAASCVLPDGTRLQAGQPIVTYAVRNLEPYRGFHIFMRALERIQAANPHCHAVIVGGVGVSYGTRAPNGKSWRETMLGEVRLDPQRTHFTGWLDREQYRRVLQVSAAHVYLTYPFVLSWSMLEAMSCGCALVASDTSPVREFVDEGVEGHLVPFHGPAAIAKRVVEVLDAGADASAVMRERARARVVRCAQVAEGIGAYVGMMRMPALADRPLHMSEGMLAEPAAPNGAGCARSDAARAPALITSLMAGQVVLLILVGPLAVYVTGGALRHRKVQDRLDKAMALFNQRCTSAGEKIHRTVDNVEGLVWMKWRPSSSNQYDQFRLDDPYGSDCGADRCILDSLRVTRGAELNPEEASRHPGRYAYVESTDPNDGKMYRYRAEVLLPWTQEEVDVYRKRIGGDPKPTSYSVNLTREPIDRPSARYGVTWDDISTREDRDHWIAGGSLKVVDLQTREVIAERMGYMIDQGQGNMGGGRQPWTHAKRSACPEIVGGMHGHPVTENARFIFRVLHSTKGE